MRGHTDGIAMIIRLPPKGRFHFTGVEADENAIYARVLSTDAAPDEGAHADFLRKRYPAHRVLSSVGEKVDFGTRRDPGDKRKIVLVWEFCEVTPPAQLASSRAP